MQLPGGSNKDDGIYFEIKPSGHQILKLKDAYAGFENLTSYSVTIKADDGDDGLNISEKKFTLSVVDINDKPILVNTVLINQLRKMTP